MVHWEQAPKYVGTGLSAVPELSDAVPGGGGE